MNEKATLKYEIFIENICIYPCKQAERDVLPTISHVTVKTLLLVTGFYTPISSFWEGPLQNSIPLSNFPTHLYQTISSL